MSNVDIYVPLVLQRADLFLAAGLFLECLDVGRSVGGWLLFLFFTFFSLFAIISSGSGIDDGYRRSVLELQLTVKTTSRKFYKIISLLLSHSRIQKFKLHVFLEDREVERGGSDVKYCTVHTRCGGRTRMITDSTTTLNKR